MRRSYCGNCEYLYKGNRECNPFYRTYWMCGLAMKAIAPMKTCPKKKGGQQ